MENKALTGTFDPQKQDVAPSNDEVFFDAVMAFQRDLDYVQKKLTELGNEINELWNGNYRSERAEAEADEQIDYLMEQANECITTGNTALDTLDKNEMFLTDAQYEIMSGFMNTYHKKIDVLARNFWDKNENNAIGNLGTLARKECFKKLGEEFEDDKEFLQDQRVSVILNPALNKGLS